MQRLCRRGGALPTTLKRFNSSEADAPMPIDVKRCDGRDVHWLFAKLSQSLHCVCSHSRRRIGQEGKLSGNFMLLDRLSHAYQSCGGSSTYCLQGVLQQPCRIWDCTESAGVTQHYQGLRGCFPYRIRSIF